MIGVLRIIGLCVLPFVPLLVAWWLCRGIDRAFERKEAEYQRVVREIRDRCEHPRLYYCAISGENECPDCGGFDACCSRPDMHREAA